MMLWTTSTVAGVPARWWWICGKRGPLAKCETFVEYIQFALTSVGGYFNAFKFVVHGGVLVS